MNLGNLIESSIRTMNYEENKEEDQDKDRLCTGEGILRSRREGGSVDIRVPLSPRGGTRPGLRLRGLDEDGFLEGHLLYEQAGVLPGGRRLRGSVPGDRRQQRQRVRIQRVDTEEPVGPRERDRRLHHERMLREVDRD